MAEHNDATHHLNAVPDLRHPSYKVVGLLAWLIVGLSILGTLAFPRIFLTAARLFTFYLLARLVVTVIFYLVGVVHCRIWETRGAPGVCVGYHTDELDDVHHVVIIPNYKEPMGVLRRTLQGLAEQKDAQQCLTVVLAMEEREAGAREKARALCELFKDRFAHLLVTVHPANRTGEIAGKGSNQAWAAHQVKQELLDRLGLPIENVTLTSCDADSVLHPRYFAELTHLFASDPQRHHRFWYAPPIYRNNIWQVPAVIRLMAFSAGAGRLGELANPWGWPMPTSTYTLSLKLADEVSYWDPVVISEDWHMYLRCFFAKHGQISITPIYLPTSSDAMSGETVWQALANYYRREVRHAWGAEDVGYILQQWRRSPGTPLRRKLHCFLRILHLNLLRSTSWFIVALGSLAAALSHNPLTTTLPGQSMRPDLIQFVSTLGVTGAMALWAVERTRCLSHSKDSRMAALTREIASWTLLPVLAFAFKALPGLHAQTKLLFGSQLTYQGTPKEASLQNLAAPPGV